MTDLPHGGMLPLNFDLPEMTMRAETVLPPENWFRFGTGAGEMIVERIGYNNDVIWFNGNTLADEPEPRVAMFRWTDHGWQHYQAPIGGGYSVSSYDPAEIDEWVDSLAQGYRETLDAVYRSAYRSLVYEATHDVGFGLIEGVEP